MREYIFDTNIFAKLLELDIQKLDLINDRLKGRLFITDVTNLEMSKISDIIKQEKLQKILHIIPFTPCPLPIFAFLDTESFLELLRNPSK